MLKSRHQYFVSGLDYSEVVFRDLRNWPLIGSFTWGSHVGNRLSAGTMSLAWFAGGAMVTRQDFYDVYWVNGID